MPVTPPDPGGGPTGPSGPGPTTAEMLEWWVCDCCLHPVPYPPYSGYYPERSDCECCGLDKIAVVVTSGVRPNWANQPCNPPCEGMIDWSHHIGQTVTLNRCYFNCGPFGETQNTQILSVYRGCLNFTARIQRPPNCGDIFLPAAVLWTVSCVSVFGPDYATQKKKLTAGYSTGVQFQAGCAPSVLEPPYFTCADVVGGPCDPPAGFTDSGAGYPNCGTSSTLNPATGTCWVEGCAVVSMPIGRIQFNDALLGVSFRGITGIKIVT